MSVRKHKKRYRATGHLRRPLDGIYALMMAHVIRETWGRKRSEPVIGIDRAENSWWITGGPHSFGLKSIPT